MDYFNASTTDTSKRSQHKRGKMNDKWNSYPSEGEIADNAKKSHIVYQAKQNQQR